MEQFICDIVTKPGFILIVVGLVLFLVVNPMVANSIQLKAEKGITVGGRTLERGDYDVPQLRKWVKEHGDKAARYVLPVLFPLDLLFIIFFGAGVAVFSLTHVEAAHVPAILIPVLPAFPILFVALDLAEDTLLAHMLTSPKAITKKLIRFVKPLTALKKYAFAVCLAQAGIILLAMVYFH